MPKHPAFVGLLPPASGEEEAWLRRRIATLHEDMIKIEANPSGLPELAVSRALDVAMLAIGEAEDALFHLKAKEMPDA